MCILINCRAVMTNGCVFIFILFNLHQSTTTLEIESSTNNNAPIEFPKNESEYPFVHNTTILKALTSQTSNDSEVDDLLHGGLLLKKSNGSIPRNEILKNTPLENSTVGRKFDFELIEDGTDNTEDAHNHSHNYSRKITDDESSSNQNFYASSKLPVDQGRLVYILAGVFIAILIIGYVGLLSWRRLLENRHGGNNREILINEEDFYEPNDMRHFSL